MGAEQIQVAASAVSTDSPQAEPKWAALVDDRVFPMPRRKLKASDVLNQAGAAVGVTLIRDLNAPSDVGYRPEAVIDLAAGNVFRTSADCRSLEAVVHAAPKLAFVVDDRWEVTVNPSQTGTSLRGLLAVPDEVELLRDLESPHDDAIADDEEVLFPEGPVFRTVRSSVVIKLNNKEVRLPRRHATALQVKVAAMAQHVQIQLDFVLYRVLSAGGLGPAIPDSEVLKLKDGDEFRCVDTDDNS